jgi:hypothetical protein
MFESLPHARKVVAACPEHHWQREERQPTPDEAQGKAAGRQPITQARKELRVREDVDRYRNGSREPELP